MEKNSAALRPCRLVNRLVVNEAILEIVCSLGESALHSRELQRGHPPPSECNEGAGTPALVQFYRQCFFQKTERRR